ncbi:MAG: amidohydrolase, partial [Desulfocapsaceae bacterium]|nr:amidohydrolase [Desulfocapsaceae bacterium]
MNFKKHRLFDWLSEVRRDIHRNPEIAFEETRTTDRIKEILTCYGVDLVELEAPATGAVGVVECQPGDRVLALRADIDGLPMEELNQAPYRSRRPGFMHACGHDGHTAIMLGVARELMETGLKNELKGAVKFIFQPAEEGVSGARVMIENGVLQTPRVDRIVAGHMWPELKAGQVGIYRQVSHASTDRFSVTITGKGAHGAKPHHGTDPILAGGHFITAVHSIVSRNLDPAQAAVVTVGQFTSGTAANVIPASAYMQGTVRAFTEDVR